MSESLASLTCPSACSPSSACSPKEPRQRFPHGMDLSTSWYSQKCFFGCQDMLYKYLYILHSIDNMYRYVYSCVAKTRHCLLCQDMPNFFFVPRHATFICAQKSKIVSAPYHQLCPIPHTNKHPWRPAPGSASAASSASTTSSAGGTNCASGTRLMLMLMEGWVLDLVTLNLASLTSNIT